MIIELNRTILLKPLFTFTKKNSGDLNTWKHAAKLTTFKRSHNISWQTFDNVVSTVTLHFIACPLHVRSQISSNMFHSPWQFTVTSPSDVPLPRLSARPSKLGQVQCVSGTVMAPPMHGRCTDLASKRRKQTLKMSICLSSLLHYFFLQLFAIVLHVITEIVLFWLKEGCMNGTICK